VCRDSNGLCETGAATPLGSLSYSDFFCSTSQRQSERGGVFNDPMIPAIPGPTRQPMLSWTRDLPIAGEPEDVVRIVDSYAQWLSTSPIPKLFIDAEPAGFLIGAQREFCRSWPNQTIVSVEGAHFLQEDSPDAVGAATAKFVSRVLAGQIS
jgi:hypothetical protein